MKNSTTQLSEYSLENFLVEEFSDFLSYSKHIPRLGCGMRGESKGSHSLSAPPPTPTSTSRSQHILVSRAASLRAASLRAASLRTASLRTASLRTASLRAAYHIDYFDPVAPRCLASRRDRRSTTARPPYIYRPWRRGGPLRQL